MSDSTSDKRIALFGGSFDPPHNGHVLSITHILNSGKVDEVWLVPSGDGRYDKSQATSGETRLELLQLLCEEVFHGDERLKVLDIQLRDEFKDCYTVDLIEYLLKKRPDSQFFFVIGTDNIEELPKWKRIDDLRELTTFLVVPREGEELPVGLPRSVELLSDSPLPSFSVSSTQIRGLLSQGTSVIGYLPEVIRSRILEEKLYSS